MGLFDIFKKKQHKEMPKEEVEDLNDLEIEYKPIGEDKLQVEFYDTKRVPGRNYDVTRLIVDTKSMYAGGKDVYNCLISWYGKTDAYRINQCDGRFICERANNYRATLVQLNLELLKLDSRYCKALSRELLDENRVEKYLEDGMKENPEILCGQYIGGIMKNKEGTYQKFFAKDIGRYSHYSEIMKSARQRKNEQRIVRRREEISVKRNESQNLQDELDDWER